MTGVSRSFVVFDMGAVEQSAGGVALNVAMEHKAVQSVFDQRPQGDAGWEQRCQVSKPRLLLYRPRQAEQGDRECWEYPE